jgi:pyruvate kinase
VLPADVNAAGRCDPEAPDAAWLIESLGRLAAELGTLEQDWSDLIRAAPPHHHQSLRNLVHYLALRRRDLRAEQHALASLGLSSLGRSESHVLGNLHAVRRALSSLTGLPAPATVPDVVTFDRGLELLERSTERLLGPAPTGRAVRIMVTMPSEAATDPGLVGDLLDQGMDVMRINCAHDGPEAWAAMIDHLRSHTGRNAPRVLMDVEGPKLRTGAIAHGPRVISWNPPRSNVGLMTRPAFLWLTARESPAAPPGPDVDATLTLPANFLAPLRAGSHISFTDHPGRKRTLVVVAADAGGVLAHCTHSAFVVPGTRFTSDAPGDAGCLLEDLPPLPGFIELAPGDRLVLTADAAPGRPALHDNAGRTIAPARVPLSPTQIFADLRPGHRVMLDDGKAVGVVERVDADNATLRITRCRGGRFRLAPEKGINLPDTDLRLPALSEDDARHIPFIARHADLLGYSFVQRPEDVELLRTALRQAGEPDLGLVLKIETAAGFRRLPELLFAAMQGPAVGVMIARGDLATQIGYERLAEVQEEILWICEAAHVPVIWATQVLETLAKKGLPSRSEITDAAMGERAECVMLNKGPFILDALKLLDDILRRMAGHQVKKRSMLRPLSVARTFGRPTPPESSPSERDRLSASDTTD